VLTLQPTGRTRFDALGFAPARLLSPAHILLGAFLQICTGLAWYGTSSTGGLAAEVFAQSPGQQGEGLARPAEFQMTQMMQDHWLDQVELPCRLSGIIFKLYILIHAAINLATSCGVTDDIMNLQI
jgi:hypothetical protein